MWGGKDKGYWKQIFCEFLEDIRDSRLCTWLEWRLRRFYAALVPKIRRFDYKSLVFVLGLVYEIRDLWDREEEEEKGRRIPKAKFHSTHWFYRLQLAAFRLREKYRRCKKLFFLWLLHPKYPNGFRLFIKNVRSRMEEEKVRLIRWLKKLFRK